MIRYEVSRIKRVGDYRILLTILNQHSIRQPDYKNDGREGTLSFTIPKADAPEISRQLKESGLVFKVLE